VKSGQFGLIIFMKNPLYIGGNHIFKFEIWQKFAKENTSWVLRKVALAIGGGTKADMVVVTSGIAKTMLAKLDVAPMNAPPSFSVFEAIQLDEPQF
jgi:hypothetical protein